MLNILLKGVGVDGLRIDSTKSIRKFPTGDFCSAFWCLEQSLLKSLVSKTPPTQGCFSRPNFYDMLHLAGEELFKKLPQDTFPLRFYISNVFSVLMQAFK